MSWPEVLFAIVAITAIVVVAIYPMRGPKSPPTRPPSDMDPTTYQPTNERNATDA